MHSVQPVINLTRPAVAGLPSPRGPLTSALFSHLRQGPHRVAPMGDEVAIASEEDFQLALYCCYELHYQGFSDVSPEWEWDPSLLAVRASMEQRLEEQLRDLVGPVEASANDVSEQLWHMATNGTGPSLSAWVAERGQLAHLQELAKHRSPYQLKEADPHTWGIPRLRGKAKAAMVAIQADEYGDGDAAAMHCALFARTMESLGLDPTPNLYLDEVPGATLLTTNIISFFGLHRRWRGALVGHLALFEMTSVEPMSRYSSAMRRLGPDEEGRRFYDVHVQADQGHQYVAVDGMVGGLLEYDPGLASDVVFGAKALQMVERQVTQRMLSDWEAGRSSLRSTPSPVPARVPYR